jgi:hypothetical protein
MTVHSSGCHVQSVRAKQARRVFRARVVPIASKPDIIDIF